MEPKVEDKQKQSKCRLCEKSVFKMEEVKAEKSVYHRKCFRCDKCSKLLSVENYQSHDGVLFCTTHFKLLFAPEVMPIEGNQKPQRPELIIRESKPAELPPEVVRASDKPDLGLSDLQNLNIHRRLKVFENGGQSDTVEAASKAGEVQSNAKPRPDGLTVGSSDESETEGSPVNGEHAVEVEQVVNLKREAMNKIKKKFEEDYQLSKDEKREGRKKEIQHIRSRLFVGKQAKIKEMYERAVSEAEDVATSKTKPVVEAETPPTLIKERFESGEMFKQASFSTANSDVLAEVSDVVEYGISKTSRGIFKELDAKAAQNENNGGKEPSARSGSAQLYKSPSMRSNTEINVATEVVKYNEKLEDVKASTSDVTQRFMFFESRKSAQRRDSEADDSVEAGLAANESTRSTAFVDESLKKSKTTSNMLNVFRSLEQQQNNPSNGDAKPPLKRFTPPPEGERRPEQAGSDSDEENIKPPPTKQDKTDEVLKEVTEAAARAKELRAKFENWQDRDSVQQDESHTSFESSEVSENTKLIRERFEQMKSTKSTTLASSASPRYQVNRFIVGSTGA